MKIKMSVCKNILILGLMISIASSMMTLEIAKAVPTPTHIVINELYYAYQNFQEPKQWVEIYNPTGSSVDLSGWILAFSLVDGVNIFPSNTVIDPGEFLIVTHGRQAFGAEFTVPTGTQVIDDDDMLNNLVAPEKDTLELLNATGVVDHLFYGGESGAAPFIAPSARAR